MRFCAVFLILLAIAGFGCRERSVSSVQPPVTPLPDVSLEVPIDPYVVLDQMVVAYKTAISYSDRATVQVVGKMSQPDIEPTPWNCIVAFLRPNKLRLEVNEGIFVSDGEDCYAQIRPLPDQVLHFPTPANWNLETLFQDVHLDSAMTLGFPPSVLRFPPQLVLLFANDPLHTFVPRDAKTEWIAGRQIGEIPCDVIQISYSDGNRILWISRENHALLRMDYQPVGLPVPEGYDSIEVIRIEMTGAEFDCNFGSETFQMLQPQEAVQVAEFHSDVPGLPTSEEHRRRLQLMVENDSYRLSDPHGGTATVPEHSLPPNTLPRTFTLTPVWSIPLVGVNTITRHSRLWLEGVVTPQLLIPYEGNLAAILDLQGNVLQRTRTAPKGLENSVIMHIRSNALFGERRFGVITSDGKFFLYDGSFEPITLQDTESTNSQTEIIRDFHFSILLPTDEGEPLLLLGVQRESVQEDVAVQSVVRAVDFQGTTRWEYPVEGILNQVSSTIVDDQVRLLVSCTAAHDSILILSPDRTALEPVSIRIGRHVLWFQYWNQTFLTLLENPDTGDVRFAGLDRYGNSQWSRLLPPGEYEVPPVFVLSEEKWLVPAPNGEIWVFDRIGNVIDKFSLSVIPTGLLCLEADGETLLIVADSETVSAWKMGKAATPENE